MDSLSPTDVVQLQLDAYNQRDIVTFLSLFHDDALIFDLGSSSPILSGKLQIQQRYQSLFANSPNLHSHLLNRISFAQVVIDLEHIIGRNGSTEPFDILAIYEVHLSKILRIHFVRNQL